MLPSAVVVQEVTFIGVDLHTKDTVGSTFYPLYTLFTIILIFVSDKDISIRLQLVAQPVSEQIYI